MQPWSGIKIFLWAGSQRTQEGENNLTHFSLLFFVHFQLILFGGACSMVTDQIVKAARHWNLVQVIPLIIQQKDWRNVKSYRILQIVLFIIFIAKYCNLEIISVFAHNSTKLPVLFAVASNLAQVWIKVW